MPDPDADRSDERMALLRALARDPLVTRAVLDAMARIPRHRFVPSSVEAYAYADRALPIGSGQTISQPAVVALMTSLLELTPEDGVLEIGTGSGYQTAVLAALARHVYSVERLAALANAASQRLHELGITNASIRCGDGWEGWPEHGPYRAILVAAAAPSLPGPLLAQLAPGGRMVIPVDRDDGEGQDLMQIERDEAGGVHERAVERVYFVPFVRDPGLAGT